ncbi:PhzF family phenazine biosynthesis protein [Nesterenkonia xinjiangensis]|uniref:PhzF family phenazine biosynthesis protein n=1 Tax=Nesterenkonia xinjiangensis TaxID=225327 RepID=A0A7Z0GL85_9MICC|nr:PhzF family phenazine biosynthesis protein [Nesterenkonia xinjiangensis]NYJ78030.1 PhzF family phenazine biosynthesis protein [Nesterenkonia xinjiangensis]
MSREFRQIDVFTTGPFTGNPLAVVADAEGLDEDTMRRFSAWTNLSECTFLLPPTVPEADYRVRIFSLDTELPFAGHPTLGTARAWLDLGGRPARDDLLIQECPAGLIRVRRDGDTLAFAAPPRLRTGPVDPQLREAIRRVLGVSEQQLVDASWADNGPGWIAVLLDSAETVLSLRPELTRGGLDDLKVGVVAPAADGDADVEVRAFFSAGRALPEDPVTGSLNASVAQWLTETGRLTAPYVAAQGTAMGRRGRVHVDADSDGTLWIGGEAKVAVRGSLEI